MVTLNPTTMHTVCINTATRVYFALDHEEPGRALTGPHKTTTGLFCGKCCGIVALVCWVQLAPRS